MRSFSWSKRKNKQQQTALISTITVRGRCEPLKSWYLYTGDRDSKYCWCQKFDLFSMKDMTGAFSPSLDERIALQPFDEQTRKSKQGAEENISQCGSVHTRHSEPQWPIKTLKDKKAKAVDCDTGQWLGALGIIQPERIMVHHATRVWRPGIYHQVVISYYKATQ